jgi:hypothetical protein
MPPARYEPTVSAGELPQTHALDRAANGTGAWSNLPEDNKLNVKFPFYRPELLKCSTDCLLRNVMVRHRHHKSPSSDRNLQFTDHQPQC